MVTIHNRYDSSKIIFHQDHINSLRDANLRNANLRYANLGYAYLSGSDLRNADLRDAHLRRANLIGADLRGADLRGANIWYAHLSCADLRGADLRGADLTYALLNDADLRSVQLPDSIPILDRPYTRILERINGGMGIDMKHWHNCKTTHCLAGWLIHLCGDEGYTLEEELGPSAAGALIHARNRPNARVPDFHASNEDAMKYIVSRANEESARSTI